SLGADAPTAPACKSNSSVKGSRFFVHKFISVHNIITANCFTANFFNKAILAQVLREDPKEFNFIQRFKLRLQAVPTVILIYIIISDKILWRSFYVELNKPKYRVVFYSVLAQNFLALLWLNEPAPCC